jgi:hypothetical protein
MKKCSINCILSGTSLNECILSGTSLNERASRKRESEYVFLNFLGSIVILTLIKDAANQRYCFSGCTVFNSHALSAALGFLVHNLAA